MFSPLVKKILVLAGLSIAFLGMLDGTARGQIFVNYTNGVGEFSAYGLPLNTAFITNLTIPQGIWIDDTNLYVVNYGDLSLATGTIGEYSTSGTIINPAIISNLNHPECVVISGTNLYVASYDDSGRVGVYTTSGGIINSNLFSSGESASGLAVSGTNIFVGNTFANRIGKYSTDGTTVNMTFISTPNPAGIALSGTNLFVANYAPGTITEYSTSGATNAAPLISGLNKPNGVAVSGNLLFVLSGPGNVGLYTTAGVPIAPTLFTVPTQFNASGIAIAPNIGSPGPPTLAAALSVANVILFWPTNAFAYLLETKTDIHSTNWAYITNKPFVTNGSYNIILPRTNSPQFFRLQSIN